MLNLAITGLGLWARQLVDSLQTDGRPKGDLVRFTHAIVRDPRKAADYADAQKLTQVTDLEAALRADGVAGLVVATPHHLHVPEIEAAARAGLPVLVEKPLALSHGEARRAVAACEAAGVLLAVGFNRRFLPGLEAVEAALRAGHLGHILSLEANHSEGFGHDYAQGYWRVTEADGRSVGLTAMGIHLFDILIRLVGPIAQVRAESARRVLDLAMDDTTHVDLRFASGVSGRVTNMVATAPTWRVAAFGTRAWMELRDQEELELRPLTGQNERKVFAPVDIERAELEAFARAVRGEAPYPVPLADVLNGVAALEGALLSLAREGAWVDLAAITEPAAAS